MADILLVHWKESEIPERAARLREAGFRVRTFSTPGTVRMRDLSTEPPAACVIDLSRLPSHGRAVAWALRQQKGTRHVPLVFVDGEPDKVARIRRDLPDAAYTRWATIGPVLRKAIGRPRSEVVVPKSMSGYSGTPLPKKLGVDRAESVMPIGSPPGLARAMGLAAGDGRLARGPRGRAQLVLLFVKSAADLKRRLPAAIRAMAEGGGLWIAWPKKASGLVTDLSESVVRSAGLAAGIVDYKVCAIDATWSGLKFARRSASGRRAKA